MIKRSPARTMYLMNKIIGPNSVTMDEDLVNGISNPLDEYMNSGAPY